MIRLRGRIAAGGRLLHLDLARLSSRGEHRIIKGSRHEIQLDQPQAVIDAVDQVLRQLQTRRKP